MVDERTRASPARDVRGSRDASGVSRHLGRARRALPATLSIRQGIGCGVVLQYAGCAAVVASIVSSFSSRSRTGARIGTWVCTSRHHPNGFKCWQSIHHTSRAPLSVRLGSSPPAHSVVACHSHLWTVREPVRSCHVFADYWGHFVGVEMAVVVGANP